MLHLFSKRYAEGLAARRRNLSEADFRLPLKTASWKYGESFEHDLGTMSEQRDFFISFTGADIEIAKALNDALNEAGFTTWFHPNDKAKGAGIADWMEVALDASRQMIAVCSPTYFDREKGYSRAERQSMFWEDPTNNASLLILVKVEEVKFPRLIAQNEYISLVGLQAPEAAKKLLVELKGEQARQDRLEVESLARDRRPPEVFNVPGGPSQLFTGREADMAKLHDRLTSNAATSATAVLGAGGIGKSTLAREYAHRNGLATRYGGVWWIQAESSNGILSGYEALADQLGTKIEKGADQVQTAKAARDWLATRPAAKPWLMIFDNAPDDESVAEFLPQGTARVLITSRYQEFDPSVAYLMRLDYWDDETTVAFLNKRAGRGTELEARALAEQLGGLPLAAEQAGAFLHQRPTMRFADYEAKLLERLRDKPPNLPAAYPDSVWATMTAALDAVQERDEGEAALDILNLCAFLSPEGVDLQLLQGTAQHTDVLPEPPRDILADDRIHEALRALTGYALLKVTEDPHWGSVLILHRLLAVVARARLTTAEADKWSMVAVRMIRAAMWSREGPMADTSVWPVYARLASHAKALRELEPAPGAAREDLGNILNEIGLYLDARGDIDGAISLLRRSLAIKEAVYGENSKELAIALGNLAGRLLAREENWEEAEMSFASRMKILEAVCEPNDPLIANTLVNWAELDSKRKRFPEAIERIERAAELDKSAHGVNSTQYANCLNNLGVTYGFWAREVPDRPDLWTKSEKLHQESFRITRALRGPRHPETATCISHLACKLADAGDIARAAQQMARAVAVDLSLDQLAHPLTQRRIAALHNYWAQSGEPERAARLSARNLADMGPFIAEIEAEHHAWVAEDPANRNFGPPSRYS